MQLRWHASDGRPECHWTAQHQGSRRPRSRWVLLSALTFGVLWFLAAGACVVPRAERITCAGALPPDHASFSQLTALVFDPLKGCTATGCHSADTQQAGVRLDTPNLIYDEFTTRTDILYGLVASGEMPDGGVRWDDADLLLFRSWYCNGAFPP